MTQPRIAIFMQDLCGGGAERAMANLASGMVRQGVGVDIVLVRALGPYLRDLDPAVRVVDLKARRTFRSIPALAGYLRRERPAALLSALTHVNVAAVLAGRIARTEARIIVCEHSYVSRARRTACWPGVRLAFAMVPWVYRHADAVLAVSDAVADDLARMARLKRHRVRTIYNPVLGPELVARSAEPPDHPWLSDGGAPVILGVGRLEPVKDFATLVLAFERLRRRRPARLMILGEGSLRGDLEALVRQRGLVSDVALPGFAANPYPYMAGASVVAASSRHEALPTVLIEAMACGTPVAAMRCPGGTAEILEEGRWGSLAPVGDVRGLAAAIGRSLDRPVPAEALRRRAEVFSIRSAVERYLVVALRDGWNNGAAHHGRDAA